MKKIPDAVILAQAAKCHATVCEKCILYADCDDVIDEAADRVLEKYRARVSKTKGMTR